jgi:hypothetical protein
MRHSVAKLVVQHLYTRDAVKNCMDPFYRAGGAKRFGELHAGFRLVIDLEQCSCMFYATLIAHAPLSFFNLQALAEEHLQQLLMDSEVKDNSHVEEMPEDFRCGVVGECIRSIEQKNDLGVQDIMTNVLEEELPGIVEGYCAQNIGGQKSGFLHECVIVTSADGVEGAAEIINPPNLEEKLSWSALTKSSAESKERQGLDVLQPVETEESELEVTAVIKALECREGEHRRSSPASTSLRVLQWNVLADGLAQFGNFHRVRCAVHESC